MAIAMEIVITECTYTLQTEWSMIVDIMKNNLE